MFRFSSLTLNVILSRKPTNKNKIDLKAVFERGGGAGGGAW